MGEVIDCEVGCVKPAAPPSAFGLAAARAAPNPRPPGYRFGLADRLAHRSVGEAAVTMVALLSQPCVRMRCVTVDHRGHGMLARALSSQCADTDGRTLADTALRPRACDHPLPGHPCRPVPMRDGVILVADHYAPVASSQAGTLLLRGPYSPAALPIRATIGLNASRGSHVVLRSRNVSDG